MPVPSAICTISPRQDCGGGDDQETYHASGDAPGGSGSLRLAGAKDLVTRAVSGHSDITMQELYSTIRDEEMRKSLAAVARLSGLSRRLPAAPSLHQGG